MKQLTKKATITLRNFIIFIILFPLIAGFFYTSGLKGLIYILVSLFIYFFIFFIFSFFYIKYIKKDFIQIDEIIKSFLYKISLVIFILFVSIWGFLYYQNNISPASLQIYKISSGNKEVIFQTMSHIGTKKFYESVELNIIRAKQKGYVLFYEGVKIEEVENKISIKEKTQIKIASKYNKNYIQNKKLKEDFNQALGIKFDKNLYKNLSKLYGLVPQDNQQFLGLINDKDFNVDLTLKEVMKIYKEKMKQKETPKKVINLDKVQDINKQIIDKLSNLNKRELKLLIWVNKGIMNFIIKNEAIRLRILELSGKQDIMGIIINDRDKHLAKEIQNSKYKKIYVIYGMMHFKGVFEELRKMDKTWKIDNIENINFVK